jgi:hypothetical protein
VKIRGTAAHIYEKYQALARDANASGDRIGAENYMQHAEHYYRILNTFQNQPGQGQNPNGGNRFPAQPGDGPQPQMGNRPMGGEDDGGEDGDREGEDAEDAEEVRA